MAVLAGATENASTVDRDANSPTATNTPVLILIVVRFLVLPLLKLIQPILQVLLLLVVVVVVVVMLCPYRQWSVVVRPVRR